MVYEEEEDEGDGDWDGAANDPGAGIICCGGLFILPLFAFYYLVYPGPPGKRANRSSPWFRIYKPWLRQEESRYYLPEAPFPVAPCYRDPLVPLPDEEGLSGVSLIGEPGHLVGNPFCPPAPRMPPLKLPSRYGGLILTEGFGQDQTDDGYQGFSPLQLSFSQENEAKDSGLAFGKGFLGIRSRKTGGLSNAWPSSSGLVTGSGPAGSGLVLGLSLFQIQRAASGRALDLDSQGAGSQEIGGVSGIGPFGSGRVTGSGPGGSGLASGTRSSQTQAPVSGLIVETYGGSSGFKDRSRKLTTVGLIDNDRDDEPSRDRGC